MAPRERVQTFPTAKGYLRTGPWELGGPGQDRTAGYAYCADQTGQGDGQPFGVEHMSLEGGKVSSPYDPGYWGVYCQQYLLDIYDNIGSNFPHLNAPLSEAGKNDVYYATLAASRSNPSRPYVDIPVNLLELGDIASLIRRQGHRAFAQEYASRNLQYQFGIAPLVGDLVKIADLQDAIAGRIRQMNRLAGSTGYRRTMSMGAWENEDHPIRTAQSNFTYIPVQYHAYTGQLIRCHVRWIPQVNFGRLSLTDRQRLAFRAALGLTVDRSTLWEALPWSWLIDWCSTAGNYFQATRNIIPAILSHVSVMRETRTEWVGDPGGGFNPPQRVKVIRHSKTRALSFVAPTAHFPFLNGTQMGIVASLAVTRS